MSDMLMSILYYALGYFYSIFVGHWLILNFSRKAWDALGEMPKNEIDMPYRWTSSLSGILDRVIYTSSLLIPAKEFIAVWLAIKVAVQWKRWDDKQDLGKARASFHIFVIGTGLSLLYGAVGALIVKWLSSKEYLPAIAVPILLVILSYSFIKVAETNVVSKGEKEMKKIDILNRLSQKADTSEEESAIDEMVTSRELYGLSEDEVRIVEGKGQ